MLFAATDAQVALAGAPLTTHTEEAARDLPMATGMIKELQKASAAMPAAAAPATMLDQFNKMQRNALNSFIHGGIHVLRRHEEGYPIELVRQLVESQTAW